MVELANPSQHGQQHPAVTSACCFLRTRSDDHYTILTLAAGGRQQRLHSFLQQVSMHQLLPSLRFCIMLGCTVTEPRAMALPIQRGRCLCVGMHHAPAVRASRTLSGSPAQHSITTVRLADDAHSLSRRWLCDSPLPPPSHLCTTSDRASSCDSWCVIS